DWLAPRDDVRHAHLRLDVPGDAERLARLLAGKAVGLVLSGGGARAMAHAGVIRALVEAGVPIDAVGGASMGGVLAAQYAMGRSPQEMEQDTREQLDRLRSPANLSFKLSSVLSSRRLDSMLQAACQNLRIEDLWIPFFCTSCNLYTAQLVVHERGLLRRALYATIALPGVFPPQLESGDVLVDGAIINALPCDVMKQCTGGVVVASDITGAVREGEAAGSGAGAPAWGGRRELPNMFDVLQHSTMLGSRHHLERLKRDADVYIPCQVGADHGLFQTTGVERLVDIGYKAGRAAVPRILEQLDEGRRSDVSGE
ncbi:MAG: patatin-like phospholipase family protein, partial [Desulfovibrionaceae bacterium]